ncbi:ComEC/Rec2 family competence protein [Candidatus Dependentiae bacterium]|nr:MAG: ComEC/Rec2 family competence protein [Candidatus Dependentiae bacterium]
MIHLFHYTPISPLTLYTAMFIVGIALEKAIPQFFIMVFIVSLWSILLYCLSIYKKEVYVICSCFATTGGWYIHYYQSIWKQNATILAKQKINITGVIINSIPSLNIADTVQYTLYIIDSAEPILKNTLLAVYIKKNTYRHNPGEIIHIRNIKCTIPDDHFATYLMKEGFVSTSHTFPKNVYKTKLKPPFWAYLYKIRFRLLSWSKKLLSSSTHALFCSLFLGYKWCEPIETNRDTFKSFKYWGLSHYLARSGLHLAILVALWYIFLSYMPLHLVKKQWLLIVVSLFYFMLTWSSISFLRAIISFILGRIFIFLNEPCTFMHIIGLTALSMLIHNPTVLFFLDFQLSFGITFLLAWLNNISQIRKTLAK